MGGRWRRRSSRSGADVLDPHGGNIPFREDDEGRAPGRARHVRDREVLVDDALARVDEHERDVGALGRPDRPELRVVLDALPLASLSPEPGRVHEDEGRLPAHEHGVDGVARRPRLVGDDDPLVADERVHEARLADVRPAEHRDPDRLLSDLGRPFARERRDDLVEEVARAGPVERRDGYRVTQAQRVELERLRIAARVVDLVRDDDHRLAGAAQDLRRSPRRPE